VIWLYGWLSLCWFWTALVRWGDWNWWCTSWLTGPLDHWSIDGNNAIIALWPLGILGMINRTFSYKPRVLVNTLYKSLVRLHLDYCSGAWWPHLRKDIDTLEKVQREPLVWSLHFEAGPWPEIDIVKLVHLRGEALMCDMINVFKLLIGFDVVAPNTF